MQLSSLFASDKNILLAALRFRSSLSFILFRLVLIEPGKLVSTFALIAVLKGCSLRKLTKRISSSGFDILCRSDRV
jgi:hypothetical protein